MQLEENISRLLGCMDDCREGGESRVGPYLKGMSSSQGWQAGGGRDIGLYLTQMGRKVQTDTVALQVG